MEAFMAMFPPSDIVGKLKPELTEKIKKTQITCIKCGEFPFMNLNAEGENITILFNCPCGNLWETNILDFFGMNWIKQAVKEAYSSTVDAKESNINIDIIRLSAECFQEWKSLLNVKTFVPYFRIKLTSNCPRHKDMTNRYFCEKCSTHVCDMCYEDHQNHSPIELNTFIDRKDIAMKTEMNAEIKTLRMKICTDVVTKMNKIIDGATKNASQIAEKTGQNVNDVINQFKDLSLSLGEDLKHCGMMQDLLHLFIQMQMQISYYLNSATNYVALANLKRNWNFNLDNFSFQKKVNENSYEEVFAAFQEVSKYIKERFWLSSKVQNDFMDVYLDLKGIKIKKVNQVVCTNTREYGKHSVKINCACILGNGDIAVGGDFPVIKVFKKEDMHCIMKFEGHKGPVNYICNMGNEFFLSCSDDKTIIKWKNKKSISRFELALKLSSKMVDKVVISAHNDKIIQVIPWGAQCFISISQDAYMKFWDDGQVPALKKPIQIQGVNFKGICLLKDKLAIATDNEIMFFDLIFCELLNNHIIQNVDCNGTNSLKSLTEKVLLVGGSHGLTLIDCTMYTIIQTISDNEFANIGNFFILSPYSFLCANDKHFFMFRYNTIVAEKVSEYKQAHSSNPTCLAEINNRSFITVSHDSTIKSWDIIFAY